MTIRIPLLAACIAAACVCDRGIAQTTPAPTDSAAATARIPARRVPRNPNLITAAEIEGQSARNAYELVTRLRPRWLRPYAATFFDEETGTPQVWVYLDGSRMGHLPELARVSAETIREMQFIPSHDAVQRWGPTYTAGAILITSR